MSNEGTTEGLSPRFGKLLNCIDSIKYDEKSYLAVF